LTSSVALVATLSDSRQLDLFVPSDSVSSIHSGAPTLEPCILAFPSTTTCERSRGAPEKPTSSSVDHPANRPASAPPSPASEPERPSGLRCCVSGSTWELNGLSWSSPRETRLGKPRSHTIWQQLAITQPELSLRLATLVRLISEGVCSFLPTPVSRDWRSPGLRSHPRLSASRGQPLPETIGSRVHPELCEWLMGFPIGATVTLPSKRSVIATPQEWPQSSGAP
jgi:hypothetical protein